MEHGKAGCRNCGFFCRRDAVNPHLSTYLEITQEDRDRQRFITATTHYSQFFPWCFRGLPLAKEICAISGLEQLPPRPTPETFNQQNQAVLEAADKHLNCDRWFQYIPGLDPKEHRFELTLVELEKQRRESAESLEAQRRTIESQEQREQARSDRFIRRLTWAAVILGAFQLLAAFVAPPVLRLLGL